MEVALNGAEPIRRRTVEAFNKLLGPVGFSASSMRPGYGMAEVTLFATGPVIVYSPAMTKNRREIAGFHQTPQVSN